MNAVEFKSRIIAQHRRLASSSFVDSRYVFPSSFNRCSPLYVFSSLLGVTRGHGT